MKIIEKMPSDTLYKKNDYRGLYIIELFDSDFKMDFYDGEPEDATLCRDFNGVYKIMELVQLAYQAGKNGEELEMEEVEIDEWE